MKLKSLFKKHHILYIAFFVFVATILSVSTTSAVVDLFNIWGKMLYVLCSIVIAAIVACFMAFGVEETMSKHRSSIKNSLLVILIEMAFTLLSFFVCKADNLVFLTPAIFVCALLAILYGYKMAYVAAVCNVMIACYMSSAENLVFAPIVLAICLMVSRMITSTNERSTLSMMGVAGAIVSFAVSASVLFVFSDNRLGDWVSVLTTSGYMAINCFVSVMLIVGILPLFEKLSGVLTEFRAQELMNQNTPLMKRLISEAPGTYHHSVMVSNLAEAASDAVGANTSLVRVAAMYHDIGKLKRPQYFVENQGGVNPHDQLDPFESRDILFSHVSEGIDMARKYKLPMDVIEIIKSHHGDSTTTYFYYKALQDQYRGDNITENDFRYGFPRPVTKEAVIVMLADCVEAAVRAMTDKTAETLSNRIDDIINGKVNDNQLSEADISIKELSIIGRKFKDVVGGYYHQRAEYIKPAAQLSTANE